MYGNHQVGSMGSNCHNLVIPVGDSYGSLRENH